MRNFGPFAIPESKQHTAFCCGGLRAGADESNLAYFKPLKFFIVKPLPLQKLWLPLKAMMLVVALLLIAGVAKTQITYTWTGTTSTNWATTGNWTKSSGTSYPGTVATDIVVIQTTATNQPTLSTALATNIASLTFTSTTAATLTITGVTLDVTGAVTLNNRATAATAANIGGTGTLSCGSVSVGNLTVPTNGNRLTTLTSTITSFNITNSITLNSRIVSGAVSNSARFTQNSGTVTADNIATVHTSTPTTIFLLGNTNPTLILTGATPLTIAGTGTSTFTFTGTGATVNYAGASQNIGITTATTTSVYRNLILSGSGTKTAVRALTVSGNWTNDGTTFAPAGFGVTLSGTTSAIGGTSTTDFAALTLASGANYTLNTTATSTGLTFTASGANSSLTQAAGANLTVNGNISIGQPTNTFTTSWNINAETATVSGLITFAGNNTTTTRIAKIVTTTGTLNANGDITFTGSAAATKIIDMSGGAGTLNLKGALTVPAASSTLTAGTTSDFNYCNAAAQTINFFTAGAYNNLSINNTNATSGATLSAAITTTNVTGNLAVGDVTPSSLFTTGNQAVGLNNSHTLTVSSGSTINAGSSVISPGTTATVSIGGTFKTANTVGFSGAATAAINSTNTPTITLGGSSTVEYTLLAGGQTITGRTYDNLRLDNTSLINTANGAITVNGTLTTTAGGTFNMGTNALDVASITSNGIIRTQNTSGAPISTGLTWTGTVNYDAGTGGQTVMSGTYGILTLGNANGTQLAEGNLIVNTLNNNTNVASVLDMGTSSLAVTNVNNTGTIRTQNTSSIPLSSGKTWGGTVNYNSATGGQTVMAGTYGVLTLGNASGTQTAEGNLIVTTLNNNTNAASVLDMGTSSLTVTTVNNTGTIRTQNTSATPVSTGRTWGGTVNYNSATGSQTVMAGTYGVLTLGNTSGTQTATGNLTVTTLNNNTDAAEILNMGANSLTVTTVNNTGTIRTQNTSATPITTGKTWGGTVQYDGAGQTIIAGTYNNLILAGSGTKAFTATVTNISSNLSIATGVVANLNTATHTTNTLTLGGIDVPSGSWGSTASAATNKNATYFGTTDSGILNCASSNCTSGYWIGITSTSWNTASNWCGGIPTASTNVVIPSGTPYSPSIGAAAVCNNLTISTGATLTITAANTLAVSGSWTNNGTFTANTSTVTFNGNAAQTIGGTTASVFSSLSITNTAAPITANTNFSATGTLTVGSGSILSPAAAVLVNGTGGTLTGTGTVQVTRITGTPDFSSQFTITTTLANLTVDYIGAGNQTVSALNYGNLTVSTNGTRTVTLANAGTIGVAGVFAPSQTNVTYIVTGSTVDFNGAGAQTINALTYNNLATSGGGTKQLGGVIATNADLTIGSGTTLDVTASNFAVSVGGIWTNNGGTLNPRTGTVTFNGTGAQSITGTAASQTFNNLVITKTAGALAMPIGSTTTLTLNDLTVTQGTMQINDNSTTIRTINVNGNLTVQSSGLITTGTGNTIGTYALPGNLPATGLYHSIYHQLVLSGDFTNNGIASFTNLADPNYGALATNGAVTVRFIGSSDNIATLNGVTKFYNLVVDKGSDKTYTLEVTSSNTANFALYGSSRLGRVETAPFTSDDPEVRKSLWIKNGTLKLTGNITIPTLSEGDCNNGNGDWAVGGNAQLWIAGANVTIYTTATTNTGFPEAPVGATGVDGGSGCQAISVYGTFRISDGFFGTRNSAGFIFWDTVNSTAEVLFEGGTTNTSIFREGNAAGKASYRQTGGNVIIRGDESEAGELAGYPLFDMENPNSTFVMSGGSMILRDKNSGGTGGNGFYINSGPGNYSVTGGTITFETNPTNTPSIDINSQANFWNLDIKRLSGAAVSTANLQHDLVVSNNLTVYSGATLLANNWPVTVAGNFTINAGGTYTPGTNTTTFNGSGNYYLWNDGTITTGLYNLVANKTLGTLILAGTATGFIVRNDFTLARDTLADGGKNLLVAGNVINNGTHKGAGKVSLNKTTGSQTISGDGTGKFANLELNNTNAQVSLAANISVTGNLSLTSSRIFNISTYLLTLEKLATVSGTFSTSCFIQTSGAASNGGVKKTFNNTSSFVFPIGTGTNYTPATLQISSAPSAYGSVTIKPVNSKHLLVSDPTCFAYYWKVEESGFTGNPVGSVSLLFNYGNLADNIAYIPGVYNPVAWVYTNDVLLVDEAANTISFPGTNSFAGDYTAGIQACFGAPVSYYSRANGNWNDPTTWSTDAVLKHAGAAASVAPVAASPVFIGDGTTYNHTVIVSANTALSGSLSLKSGSVLDLGSTSGNNFGTVLSGSTGKMRITSSAATAIFPAGDFGNFLGATGGTVEYYTSGVQDFTIPVTSAAPTSATIANYYNLMLTPQTGRQITMPNTNLIVYNDLTVQGASATGLVNLNGAAARNLSINNNLNITGGNLIFKNAFAQTLTVGGNITISSGALFNVAGTGAAVNNTISIGGSLINNGTFDMSVGTGQLCSAIFTGVSNVTISGTGATTDFYSINVNKGTSATPVLDVTSSAFTFTNNNSPLTLTNGTFRLTSAVPVNISTTTFSIPSTTCLSSNGGIISISTAASDANDIDLGGKIEIKAGSGSITIGTSTNANNNDVIYQGTGTPTIDIQGGTFFVNGQIRRNLLNALGSLVYKQSGSSSVTINGQNSQNTRAKLEVLNAGSIFEMSSTSTLTIVRGAGTSFYDLYLDPTTSTVTGGTITFGSAQTVGASLGFTLYSAVPINNLTVDGTTNAKTVALSGSNLTLLGNLYINATSVFNANSLNVNIAGNLTNLNTDATTGVTNGGFRPGSTTQTTTFNGSANNQTITGATANLTNFANLVTNNTNTGGTVTLAANSAIRVNHDLTLTKGTLADGGNVITVLGDVSNSAAHSGTGRITLGGTAVQVISGDGTGIFGNLYLNSNYDVQMTASQEFTGILTFDTKMLDIGANLLKLSNTSSGATAGSSGTAYIKMNGLVTDLGVQKSYPSGALSYTFPVGITGKYTPALINVTANSAVGTVTVIPVNSKHAGTTDPLDKQLNYYWNVRKTGFSSPTVTHAYTYVPGDVTGTESLYVARRYTGALWESTGTSVTLATHTANFAGISSIEGDFTAGEISEFGAVKTYYSRNATSGGNWDDVNTWSTVSHAGAVDGTFPNGQPVYIASGHTVTTNGSSRNAYSVDLGGTLDLAGTTGHNFGVVSGTGKLKISPAISGNFVFPSGDFSVFNSSIGGTVEYNNTSGTAIFPSQSTYNNILLSGNGTKQMYNTDISIIGNITNSNGSTFVASNANKLILSGNWINNGTFTHNSGNIEFNGNSTISGSSASTFNNLTVLSGKTLVGAASANFGVAGNWSNNGTFTHNSGTVTFGGTTTISGSSTTTFNNLVIGSTLTGRLNSGIVVQGNWTNNGTFNYNGGTIIFDGTTTVSGSSVTSFGSVVINAGKTLTAPATMNIALNFTGDGTFTHSGGTVVFNGATQTIAGTVPTPFNNITISTGSTTTISTSGQTIKGILLCNGTLAANTNLSLLSDASQTALIDGTGIGDVTGNVYIKRYLSTGFGYKYFSSPFQMATVSQLSTWVNLSATFPTVYRYDEYRAARGWIQYTIGTGVLNPMNGYAINLGPNTAAITLNLSGVVNNKILSPITLTNHNMTYTLGFNLIGNPYPSPIDWKAATGWTKTNVDDAIYFFNASSPSDALANDSLRYQGVYTACVNGVASGTATRIIPTMQGFFVHVSTTSPTDATIIFDNGIRTNDLNPVYKSELVDYRPVLRFSASFDQLNSTPDNYVIYLDDQATKNFDGEFDALKMLNTDYRVPNLYEISNKKNILSISGIPYPVDSITTIPIGIKTAKEGWLIFEAKDLSTLPSEYTIYLVDKASHLNQNLRENPKYKFYLKPGEVNQRFELVFVLKDAVFKPNLTESANLFTLSRLGETLLVQTNLAAEDSGELMIYNMLGQKMMNEKVTGNQTFEIGGGWKSGIYLITLVAGKNSYSEKTIIRRQ